VLVTRALDQAGKLSEGLRGLGAEAVEVPVLEIRPPESFEALDAALKRFDDYDWLVLTSSNAARAMKERATQLRIVLDQPDSMQVAAVGEATAAAGAAAGFQIKFVPESYVAESLLEGLTAHVAGKRILLARAAVARDVIPDALRSAGAELDVVDAYRNVLPDGAAELLRRALEERIDAATFTSSSSVTHLAEAARQAWVKWPLPGVPAVSIGRRTSQTLWELNWQPADEANPSDIPGLIEAVVRVLHA
jgi:uroporphyrinogen-III synthase/uroporphyrinogen III methyltransferase/synthase